MKLPFITRRTHEQIVEEVRGRIVVYVPTPYPVNEKGEKVQIPGNGFCYHDRRIGWVVAKEFKDHDEYVNYLKEERKSVELMK